MKCQRRGGNGVGAGCAGSAVAEAVVVIYRGIILAGRRALQLGVKAWRELVTPSTPSIENISFGPAVL